MIDCELAPVDQVFPVVYEEVNTTDPPVHNEVDPPAVMIGAAGIGFTVTLITFDEAEEHDPSTITTE